MDREVTERVERLATDANVIPERLAGYVDYTALINLVFLTLGDMLAEGKSIKIPDFGNLEVREHGGTFPNQPRHKRVSFRVDPSLRSRVNSKH